MINENLDVFQGQTVYDWEGEAEPAEFAQTAYRLRVEYEDEQTLIDKLHNLLDAEGSEQLKSLAIGFWQGEDSSRDSAEIIEALVSIRDKLPNLENLFIGDITSEENEISWIVLSDMGPLLAAYPKLRHLTVRGGEGLSFGRIAHDHLEELVIQSGGLAPAVVQEVAAARLPALRKLELWLGDPGYGGDTTIDDLAPLFQAGRFPMLRYLGLCNSAIENEIAGVVALAPVLEQLEVLDLSRGTLGDIGAAPLLNSPGIRRLKKLDLHFHYLTDEMQAAFKVLGIEVDLSDPQEPNEPGTEDDRFISVAE